MGFNKTKISGDEYLFNCSHTLYDSNQPDKERIGIGELDGRIYLCDLDWLFKPHHYDFVHFVVCHSVDEVIKEGLEYGWIEEKTYEGEKDFCFRTDSFARNYTTYEKWLEERKLI